MSDCMTCEWCRVCGLHPICETCSSPLCRDCGCYRAWHDEKVGMCRSHVDNDRYCRCKGYRQ